MSSLARKISSAADFLYGTNHPKLIEARMLLLKAWDLVNQVIEEDQ